MSVRLSRSPFARDLEKYIEVFTEIVKYWRISIGHDPSLFVSVRLSGSPIARDLEKYTEAFTEGVKCWRIDSIGHGRTRPVSLCVGSTERKSDRERFRKITLMKETTKLSALLATSTHHVCIRRSLSHEPTCVGHKSKRKGRSLVTYCGKQ